MDKKREKPGFADFVDHSVSDEFLINIKSIDTTDFNSWDNLL